MSAPRLMHAVTAPISALIFLEGQLRVARESGFEVHVLCGSDPSGRLARRCEEEGATLHEVEVTRAPSVRGDAKALAQVAGVLHRVRPDVLVAGTPKMSLLALSVGRALRLPYRVYLCHGLRFEGASGWRRAALIRVELLLCRLASTVVAVSPSVARELSRAGAPASRMTVLGSGSPNGVDLDRFRHATPHARESARLRLGLPPDGRVLTFVGRLTGDKGLPTLVALAHALGDGDDSGGDDRWLILVGDPELGSAQDRDDLAALRANPRVVLVGHWEDMRVPYAASDVLVLPTRREGLPTVVIEAAAAQVPTVAYAVTGTVDAIRDRDTGLLVPAEDVSSFVAAALHLVDDPSICTRLGRRAREHVEQNFARRLVWNHWADFLASAVGRRGRTISPPPVHGGL